MARELYVMIERDEDGFFLGEVPQLRACYAQGRTVEEMLANIREVVDLCLADEPDVTTMEFVGIQKLVI